MKTSYRLHTFDELQDITYQEALFLILSAMLHAITEALILSEEEQHRLVEVLLDLLSLSFSMRMASTARSPNCEKCVTKDLQAYYILLKI